MMNTILLKESEIKKLVSMRDIIEIVDKTFVDLGEGKTINPTKLNLNLGDSEPTNLPYKASLNAMPAYIAWQDMAGQKWAGGWGKGRREIGRPFINALIMLVHPNYGDFLAVMDGAWITNMRTGAQTAVILRYLLKDKKDITVGLYGAGVQGRTQTEALTAGLETGILHAAGSSVLMSGRAPELDAVRVGSAFLGRCRRHRNDGLQTVGRGEATLEEIRWLPKGHTVGNSRLITMKKPTRVAVLPVGYQNGLGAQRPGESGLAALLRYWWGTRRQSVHIGDQRAMVIGQIGALETLVDVTELKCKPGDIAVFDLDPLYARGMKREYR